MGDDEEPLIGNVTSGVVRVGDTIRRPVGPWSDTVDVLLEYLYDVGLADLHTALAGFVRADRVLVSGGRVAEGGG